MKLNKYNFFFYKICVKIVLFTFTLSQKNENEHYAPSLVFLINYSDEGCSIELNEPLNSFRAAGLFH